MLCIWGDPEVTGKPVHGDLRERKKTFPVLAALDAPLPGRCTGPRVGLRRLCGASPEAQRAGSTAVGRWSCLVSRPAAQAGPSARPGAWHSCRRVRHRVPLRGRCGAGVIEGWCCRRGDLCPAAGLPAPGSTRSPKSSGNGWTTTRQATGVAGEHVEFIEAVVSRSPDRPIRLVELSTLTSIGVSTSSDAHRTRRPVGRDSPVCGGFAQ